MEVTQAENAINILGDKPTLNNFIQNIELFATSPNGIYRLKKLILDMAVSGKLTKSDSSDDNVNLYVSDINAKRNELIQLKKAKPYKKICVSLRENLPINWVCLELGEAFVPISVGQNKIKTKDVLESGEFPVVDQGKSFIAGYSNHKDKLIKIDSPVIIFGDHTKALKLIDFDFIAGADGVKVLLPLEINPQYFFIVLKSYSLDERDYGRHYKILLDNDFPLPSTQEQKRIVAKVDELMALCDQLEAQQQQQANTLLNANTAAIQSFLSPDSIKADLTKNWQRLADNFHTLYGNTLPMPPGEGRLKKYLVGLDNVKQLKQLVIYLGVTGALVNSVNYKNASDDLNEMGIKISSVTGPFKVPTNWRWVTLGELSEIITSGSRGWKKYYSESGDIFIRSQDIKYDKLFLEDKAYVLLPDNVEGKRTKVSNGDILITITGANVGKCALVKNISENAYVSQHVALVKLVSTCYSDYLHRWITNGYGGRQVLIKDSYGDKPGLNLKQVASLLVPFPPLEEQKKIVARVDELMGICDQLENQLTQAYSDAERLLTATAKALVA